MVNGNAGSKTKSYEKNVPGEMFTNDWFFENSI